MDLRERRRGRSEPRRRTSATSTSSSHRGRSSGCSSRRRTTYEIAANWKTITENYHECYHCPSIHPALCDVTPVDSGENFAHDGMWVGGNDGAEGLRRDDVADGGVRWRADPGAGRPPAPGGLLLRALPQPVDQPASRLRDDPPDRAPRARSDAGSSVSGSSRPRRTTGRASAPRTRASSGTSRTARTGSPASRCTRGLQSRGLPSGAVRVERGRGPRLHGDGRSGLRRRAREPPSAGPRAERLAGA